jgi:hypothetical protein
MIKNKYTDGHGYEITGLEEAKTKDEKIKALENHLRFLEMHHIEVYNGVERMRDEIKYPNLYKQK